MTEVKPRNRGGRPKKTPDEGPRITHATRLRPTLAAKLAESAEANHRSLGEEIEHRLADSFVKRDDIDDEISKAVAIKTAIFDAMRSVMEAQRRVDDVTIRYRASVSDRSRILEEYSRANTSVRTVLDYLNKEQSIPEWVANIYGTDDLNELNERQRSCKIDLDHVDNQISNLANEYKYAISIRDSAQSVYDEIYNKNKLRETGSTTQSTDLKS